MIIAHFSETLLEVSIDNFNFKITWNPIEKESCIIWFQDVHTSDVFEALGKFSNFDKRSVLEFITRFTTSYDLRQEIELRRFERKISNLTPEYFESINKMSVKKKEQAYKQLFNLDSVLETADIEKKRKVMAKVFHPDVGGDNISMSVINEAYDYLSQQGFKK